MIVAAMFYSAYVAADIIFHSQLVFVESARTFKNSKHAACRRQRSGSGSVRFS